MSSTRQAPTPLDQQGQPAEGDRPADAPQQGAPDGPADTRGPAGARRRIWAAAAAVAMLGATGVGVAVLASRDRSTALPDGDAAIVPKTAPITLPASVLGLPVLPAVADPTQLSRWKVKASQAGAGATVTGRTYGTGTLNARTVRLVAGRADLTGQLEQLWAAGSGEAVGDARCTNNTIIVKGTPARVRPTVMLCWRDSATLSAYSLIIDPASTTPVTTADGVAAVDAAWNAARQAG